MTIVHYVFFFPNICANHIQIFKELALATRVKILMTFGNKYNTAAHEATPDFLLS